ncbi:MAG: hypothetical protein ACREPQ_14175 [Rhodanobacter sp.]
MTDPAGITWAWELVRDGLICASGFGVDSLHATVRGHLKHARMHDRLQSGAQEVHAVYMQKCATEGADFRVYIFAVDSLKTAERFAISLGTRHGFVLADPADPTKPMSPPDCENLFTVLVQRNEGRVTALIPVQTRGDIEAAKVAARTEGARRWQLGIENVRVLGVIAGDIHVLEWF